MDLVACWGNLLACFQSSGAAPQVCEDFTPAPHLSICIYIESSGAILPSVVP